MMCITEDVSIFWWPDFSTNYKSGAGGKVTDIITEPRNAELAEQVRNSTPQVPEETQSEEVPVEGEGEGEVPVEEQYYE